jgi:ABC-type glycerol-3-phosphate transport system substrate-binding protein
MTSRRAFLKAAVVAAGASVLAACAPKASPGGDTQVAGSTPISAPNETQIVLQAPTAVSVPTAVSAPTGLPAAAVMDVWFNIDIPDLNVYDPNLPKGTDWAARGLGHTMFVPWQARHPGVTMKITGHGWDFELRQNQLAALAAGLIPDVTYGEAYVSEFVQMGVYSPVSNDVAKLFADASTRAALLDGRYYGLPKMSGANVLFVNLDTVSAAGGDPARLPATWEELLTLAQAISKNNKSAKWGNTAYWNAIPSGDSYGDALRILHWFNQNDAPLGSDLGVPSANAPKAAETWDFLNQLLATSSKNVLLSADADPTQLFIDGVIGLMPGWSADALYISFAGEPGPNMAAIPFPVPPGGHPATIVVGNDIMSPLKNGPNPELAINLTEETVSDPDAQAFIPQNVGNWIPALKSLLEQYPTYDRLDGFLTVAARKAARVTMRALLEGGGGPLPGWPRNGTRIWAAWNSAFVRIWDRNLGQAAIQTELDALQTKIEDLLARPA